MLWHEGRTCQQYDDSPEGEIIRTTEQRVRKMSKLCPGKNGRCGARIMKAGGCDMVSETHGIFFETVLWLFCVRVVTDLVCGLSLGLTDRGALFEL